MAEPFFLGGLPSIAANTKPIFQLSGVMPEGYELRQLHVSTEFTIKSSAATFNWAAADMNTIIAQLVSRIRLAAFGVEDAINLVPTELRTIAIYATGRDPWVTDVNARVGSAIPATGAAANTVRVNLCIPFVQRGLDTPEMVCPSTDQFNVPGHKLTVEIGPQTGLGALVLTGGTAVVTFTAVNVYAIVSPVQFVHFGPCHYMRNITLTQNRYSEDGKFWDLLWADERDPYTLEAQVSQVFMIRDGRTSPSAIPPGKMAAVFQELSHPADGLVTADITKNTLGGVGSQVTPYAFISGDARTSEWQYNTITRRNRTLFQNLAPAGSANATILYWQIRPVAEQYPELVKLVNRFQLAINSVDDLQPRYGAVQSDFKGRYLALKGTIQAP
jgi:hypothetical protein